MSRGNFAEPRDVIPLPPEVTKRFAARPHRLHHAAWHSLRDMWASAAVADDVRMQIADLGWRPPRVSLEYIGTIVKRPANDNGSGEDFLFMHRQMLAEFREAMVAAGADPQVTWPVPPQPGAEKPGEAVPPDWETSSPNLTRRLTALKSDDYFWSRMRWWDREFKDPIRLCTLTLGALGALIEYSIHNDMHMRWSSMPHNPQTEVPLPDGRPETDFSTKWDDPKYDFLGEFYSSHVNPIFWRLHGWVDSRIDDWFAAHEKVHPGKVKRADVGGVPWFAAGDWVVAADPWSGAAPHHGHAGHPSEDDMLKVLQLLFPTTAPAPAAAAVGDRRAIADGHGSWFLAF